MLAFSKIAGVTTMVSAITLTSSAMLTHGDDEFFQTSNDDGLPMNSMKEPLAGKLGGQLKTITEVDENEPVNSDDSASTADTENSSELSTKSDGAESVGDKTDDAAQSRNQEAWHMAHGSTDQDLFDGKKALTTPKPAEDDVAEKIEQLLKDRHFYKKAIDVSTREHDDPTMGSAYSKLEDLNAQLQAIRQREDEQLPAHQATGQDLLEAKSALESVGDDVVRFLKPVIQFEDNAYENEEDWIETLAEDFQKLELSNSLVAFSKVQENLVNPNTLAAAKDVIKRLDDINNVDDIVDEVVGRTTRSDRLKKEEADKEAAERLKMEEADKEAAERQNSDENNLQVATDGRSKTSFFQWPFRK